MYNQEICKILVVDDEIGMTKGVEKALRNYSVSIDVNQTDVNYQIESVMSGKEFYKVIEERDFDLILLDYKLPDVTGLELLEYIMNKKKNNLVIMITAYATFETAVQSTKLGAYDFLAKPFSPEELRSSVKKATVHLILARQARKYDEERRKIRFQFISVLSHELKAPLNAIEGYVDILSKRYNNISEEDYNNMLGRTKLRIDGMRKLIFDLLDMTRIESGEKKRKLEEFDIIDLTKSAIELFEINARERGIKIILTNQSPIIFYGDISEIEIVLNNLISNAVKYNRDNGTVKIKLSKIEDRVTILVLDTGIGISQEDIPRLFHEFARIKNENTFHILGSGLGLSTVKKVAGLYQGYVKVKSIYEKGTAFFITLKDASIKVS